MARCRVVERADGTVTVIHPAPNARRPDESEDECYARVVERAMAADPNLAGRPFVDVDASELPQSRARRHAWRMKPDRSGVAEDPNVPDPVRPAEELEAAIANARSLEELKAALLGQARGAAVAARRLHGA